MKITEPYSPTPRANAIAKPVSSEGPIAGRMTLRKVVNLLAPRLAAASDRKSTRLNPSHYCATRMPSSACKKKAPHILVANTPYDHNLISIYTHVVSSNTTQQH